MLPLNLIFDGNYLFHKTRHVTMGYGKRSGKYLDKKADQEIFIRKVAMDFVSVIKTFDGCSNVIFTKDGKSWRKAKYKYYKANRTQSDDLNREVFYEMRDELMGIIAESGVVISTLEKAEGDDLMYLWSDYSLKNNVACNVVVTADADLTQIVSKTNTAFTVIYNSNSKLVKIVAPLGFSDWSNSYEPPLSSIFDVDKTANIEKSGFSIIKTLGKQIPVEELDPNKVVLEKILCGDKGDNIGSVYSWTNAKNNTQRITPRHVQPIYDYLIHKYGSVNILDILSDTKVKNNIRLTLEELTKIKIGTEQFAKQLDENIDLVYLHKNIIPSSIIDDFNEIADRILTSKTKSFDRFKLLKNTRFDKSFDTYSDVFDMFKG